MALSFSAITWLGLNPPAFTGQVLAEGDVRGSAGQRLSGKITVTGDGGTSSGLFNWIDGTQKLPFKPTGGVLSSRMGGNDTATIDVVSIVPTNASEDVSATIQFSANVTNNGTQVICFELFKL